MRKYEGGEEQIQLALIIHRWVSPIILSHHLGSVAWILQRGDVDDGG